MDAFFAALYELITGQSDLAFILYEEGGFYLTVGLLMSLLSLAGMALYYIVIDHPAYIRCFHWLLMMVVVGLINFAIAYFMADGVVFSIYGTTSGFVTQIITFGISNVVWTLVFSFVFSMCLKWKSNNCSHTPF